MYKLQTIWEEFFYTFLVWLYILLMCEKYGIKYENIYC
jgi:hypothetical protein